jgi:hypothetical protein
MGQESVSQNGYTYVKTPDGTRLKHHLVAEKKLGRKIDTNFERVIFKDGDRKNFDEGNIEVVLKKAETRKMVLERIDERLEELQERKRQLLAEEAAEQDGVQSQSEAS